MSQALDDRDLGAILTIYRRWTGATQPQIASATGVPQPTISAILNGKRQVISLKLFEKFARGLGIPRHRLGLAEPSADDPPQPPSPAEPDRRTVLAAGIALAADEEIDEITERMRLGASSNVDEPLLHQLDATVESIGHRYEAGDAKAVYPTALAHRRTVHELLAGRQHHRQRTHLHVLAGKLSGLLGYLAFDLGNERVARAYCNEAFSLAQAAGDNPLAAWVRGTQSFIAYYGGHYTSALDLARDGQRYAGDGPHSIRLAVSGEARTLGRLGDRAGVDDAVARALAAHDRIDDADPVGVFLSFEPLGRARIAGNAASAYLAVGAFDQVRAFAEQAIPTFAAGHSAASHALTLVDLSMTYLLDAAPEPGRAGALVGEALRVGAALRSEVVSRRAAEFVTAAARHRDVPEIAAVADAVGSWRTAR
jgi:transcriptional regulator with XRE-family HTH domain